MRGWRAQCRHCGSGRLECQFQFQESGSTRAFASWHWNWRLERVLCDHPPMSNLLFNLRNVPDDEADDVRELLDAHAIEYFETRPSLFGLSAGAIWAQQREQVDEARRLIADYQQRRQATARDAYAAARAAGEVPSFADQLRTQPLRVLLVLVGIVMMLAAMVVPFWFLKG